MIVQYYAHKPQHAYWKVCTIPWGNIHISLFARVFVPEPQNNLQNEFPCSMSNNLLEYCWQIWSQFMLQRLLAIPDRTRWCSGIGTHSVSTHTQSIRWNARVELWLHWLVCTMEHWLLFDWSGVCVQRWSFKWMQPRHWPLRSNRNCPRSIQIELSANHHFRSPVPEYFNCSALVAMLSEWVGALITNLWRMGRMWHACKRCDTQSDSQLHFASDSMK